MNARVERAGNRILLCGASVRSLARTAIASGLYPVCVDFFADADLLQLLSSDRGTMLARLESFAELPDILDSMDPSIPMVCVGGLENWPQVLERIRHRRHVIGSCPAAIQMVRDPGWLAKTLAQADCHVPRTMTATQQHLDALTEPGDRWLLRDARSSGGMGISRLAPQSRIQPQSRDVWLQEYVAGLPMSATFLVHPQRNGSAESDYADGCPKPLPSQHIEWLGCCLQLSGWDCLHAPEFRFCGNFGPVPVSVSLEDQLRRAAQIIVRAAGLEGVFGIDFLLRDGRPVFLEVNPRITASHEQIELATGRSMLRELLCESGWNLPEPGGGEAAVRRASGDFGGSLLRMILYSDRPRPADPIFAETHYELMSASAGFRPDSRLWIADVPPPKTMLERGQPVCSVYSVVRAALSNSTGSWADDRTGIGTLLQHLNISAGQVCEELLQMERRYRLECVDPD